MKADPALKLVFFIGKFLTVQGGGAERSLAELMNEMCRRGHDVTLVVREAEARADQKLFYDLHPEVKIRNLSRWADGKRASHGGPVPGSGIRRLLSRIRMSFRNRIGGTRLRNVLTELHPDLVVVFLVSHFSFVSREMRKSDIPLVLCHRNDPAAKLRELESKGSKRVGGLDRAHDRAAAVTVQMESYKTRLPPDVQPKTVVIPNVCLDLSSSGSPVQEGREKVVLSVGRLAPVKNHALLIKAFAKVARQEPDWHIEIYGDGPERGALEALIASNDLQKRVHLKGNVSNINEAYRRASIFAFPSHYEGFSRALTEAMAHELPVICLRSCDFCRETVQVSTAGLLSDGQTDDYAKALATLMNDPSLRQKLGQNGRAFTRQFDAAKIYDRWERLFFEVRLEAGSAAGGGHEIREGGG